MVFPEFMTVVTIHILALISPGPDFILISQTGLSYSKKTALYCAAGIALGVLVHVTYSLMGIGMIMSQSIVVFTCLKYACAAYLLYIGYRALKVSQRHGNNMDIPNITPTSSEKSLSAFSAIRRGFFTNALNPKCAMTFFSLFTQVIDPHTSFFMQSLYGFTMVVTTFMWFALVSHLVTISALKTKLKNIQHHIERFMGGLLILLGIRIALVK